MVSRLTLIARRRMLEDETLTSYVSWSKNEHSDAICIPNIEAFVVNVMPTHFKEMKQVYIAATSAGLSDDLIPRFITVG